MALTPEKIDEIAGPADYFDRRVFARAIESEVRKQDAELIERVMAKAEVFAFHIPWSERQEAARAALRLELENALDAQDRLFWEACAPHGKVGEVVYLTYKTKRDAAQGVER